MPQKYFVGLDLGTTTVKATVYLFDGTVVKQASKERILLTPRAGYCEQDALTWYYDSAEVVRQAAQGLNKSAVAGLSVSSQGITTVCCDENFMPLTNAINWMDTREVSSWNSLVDTVGLDYFVNTTGFPVKRGIPKGVAKVMWVRESLPAVFAKTRYILMPSSFLTTHLTGNAIIDHTMAAGSLVYSFEKRDWDERLLEGSAIDRAMLPEIADAGTSAGHLTKKAAEDFGLTENCVVAVGGQDQKVAAYGIGADEGVASCSLGTSAAFEFISENKPEALPEGFKLCPYITPGLLASECCINSAGASIRWVNENICDRLDYNKMNGLAAASPKGSNGVMFMPFLGGHPNGNGFGEYRNLCLANGKGDLIRAMYEGIALEAKYLFSLGYTNKIKCIRVFSGASKSGILCQILADALNVEIQTLEHSEMGSLGAAKLAAKAVGEDTSKFGCETINRFSRFTPSAGREIYDTIFEKYKLIR